MRKIAALSLAALIGLFGDSAERKAEKSIQKDTGVEEFMSMYDKVLRMDKFVPYESSSFKPVTGTLVKASRDEGIDYLVKQARIVSLEEGWAYLPKAKLWVNVSINATEDSADIDDYLKFTVLNLEDTLEFYHIHPEDQLNRIPQEFKDTYGPSLMYVPSPPDNFSTLTYSYSYSNHITHCVVSSEGVMKIYVPPVPQSSKILPLIMVQGSFLINSRLMTSYLLEHFKGCDPRDLEWKAREIEGLNISFEPHLKKNK